MEVMLSWYPVSNLEAAKKFYGEVLGLKKVFEMEGWAEYSHAEGAAAIGLSANPEGGPGGTVVLKVDDLDRARKQLAQKGVKFDGEVQEVPGVVRIATFQDSSGNRLQLVQSLVKQ